MEQAEEHMFRVLPGERLVGARYSGVGVSAAGAVSGEELCDDDFAVGGTLDALEPFRVPALDERGEIREPLPYLECEAGSGARWLRPEPRSVAGDREDAGGRDGAGASEPRKLRGFVLDTGADADPSREQWVQSAARAIWWRRGRCQGRRRTRWGRYWNGRNAGRSRWICRMGSRGSFWRMATR